MQRVCIPASRTPIFPDACIRCGCPSPGYTVRVRSAVTRKWFASPAVPVGEWGADVPACESCAAGITSQRRARFGLVAVCLVVGTCVAFFLTAGLGPPWRDWAMVGIISASLLPCFGYERWFPRPVALEMEDGWAVFRFRDRAFAEEFARLNDQAG